MEEHEELCYLNIVANAMISKSVSHQQHNNDSEHKTINEEKNHNLTFPDSYKLHNSTKLLQLNNSPLAIFGLNFTSEEKDLNIHMNSLHEKYSENNSSNLYSKGNEFVYINYRQTDTLSNVVESPFMCFESGCQCAHKYQGNNRIFIENQPHEKSFDCPECSYKSARKCMLIDHQRIHTGEKPFACSKCELAFSLMSNLKKHMHTHTGERKFACSFCKYSSSQKCNLKRHIRTHTGEKPYTCSICEYSSSQKNNLLIHMKVHTGEKFLTCSYCEYKCTQSRRLSSHIRIHTGEKPFSCDKCNYKCSNKNNLKRHMLTKVCLKIPEVE